MSKPYGLLIHEHRYDGAPPPGYGLLIHESRYDGAPQGYGLLIHESRYDEFSPFGDEETSGTYDQPLGPELPPSTAPSIDTTSWYNKVDWAGIATGTAQTAAAIINAATGNTNAATADAGVCGPGKVLFDGRCFTPGELATYAKDKAANNMTPILLGAAAIGGAILLITMMRRRDSAAPAAMNGYRRRRRSVRRR